MKLREFTDEDVELMMKWLKEPHIAKWYYPTEAWVEEIELRKTKYDFIRHFIVEEDGHPIGFCQYYDYTKGEEDWNGSVPAEGSYSLDYLIGDLNYLGCGNGPKMVKLLTEEIYQNTCAKRIIVQPEPENIKSRRTLLSSGYTYDEKNDLFIVIKD